MRLTIPRFIQALTEMERDMECVNNVPVIPGVAPSMSSDEISPPFPFMMEKPQAKK